MIKIRTNDGTIFQGDSFEAVVEAMRQDMRLDKDPDIETYMQGCIHRLKVWTGKTIRFTSAEEFVAELVRVGVAEILKEEIE
jgi:hypothetical protein